MIHGEEKTSYNLTVTTPTFQWLSKDFLGYLTEWETEVASLPGVKPAEKQKLTLSSEMMDGVKITGMCSILH